MSRAPLARAYGTSFRSSSVAPLLLREEGLRRGRESEGKGLLLAAPGGWERRREGLWREGRVGWASHARRDLMHAMQRAHRRRWGPPA